MTFRPFTQLILKTHLQPAAVRQRLADAIQNQIVRGTVSQNTFEIRRVIHYTNSFLPIMKGKIKSTGEGSIIKVTMAPHILIICFMVSWLGFASGLLAIAAFHLLELSIVLIGFIPVGMLIFGYIFVTAAFKFEARQSILCLRQLLAIA
ncbi:hypothetical protein [Picosynechococcus sp. PCC 73109]|uniref:hypothetical protein n=1 Tax=Picosynechococcus sp. PCC 73109 TaxID=374982 RepID=UPI00074594BB|nr:hypothetical protein [Picosynechococcus sp. PCC 73109]AMA10360.1 hypothetical protein AWQ23_14150 [Picosynechococcus sp. PCC 73109]